MELFWRKGFAATSISELCTAMGVGSPSLYAAFGSKEALYEEALRHYVETAGPLIWGAFAEAATAREAISALLQASARALPMPGPKGCMVTLSGMGEEVSPRLDCIASAARAEGLAAIRARLARAVEAKEIAPDTGIEAVARFYLGVQQGMSIQARDGADQPQLEAMAQAAMTAWEGLTQPRE